jgi:hypothetical protein
MRRSMTPINHMDDMPIIRASAMTARRGIAWMSLMVRKSRRRRRTLMGPRLGIHEPMTMMKSKQFHELWKYLREAR